jgi:hypothetical protein
MKTMKSISKVTMLLAFVAFANTLMATGNIKIDILPLTSEKAVVSISNSDDSNFQIVIENSNGEKVYYNSIGASNEDYRKVFDFSDLESGDYKLSASVDGLTSERQFRIENSNIVVGKENSVMKPYFSYKEGVLKLSYLNFPEENVKLNFYNNDNDLVYSKEIGNQFNVTKGFDLSKLEKGSYSVILSTISESFSYNLNVK